MLNTTLVLFAYFWFAAIVMVSTTRNFLWLLLPYLAFIIEEMLFYATNMELMFSGADRTATFYDIALLGQKLGSDVTDDNYSEGYYVNLEGKEDYSVSSRQAENQKFAKILELIGAERGDTILNMGCGTCTFEAFCHTRGIHMIGITISSEQKKLCEKKGEEAVIWNYHHFNEDLVNTADHIICMGTTEHIQTGAANSMRAYEKKVEVSAKIFKTFQRYFKKDGKQHNLSGLHQNKACIHDWALMPLQRCYGGLYFLDTDGLDARAMARKSGYTVTHWADHTKDYFMPSKLDPNHFGNPSPFFSKSSIMLFLVGLLYPYAMYTWVYTVTGCWMYMFDQKLHFHRPGENDFTLETPGKVPCPLYWGVFSHRAVASQSAEAIR